MYRLWLNVLLSLLYSYVSAKLYVQELHPASGNLEDVRAYRDALSLLQKFVAVFESNDESDPKASNENNEQEIEAIPLDGRSLNNILRGREIINCYNRKHLSMICTNTCVGAIEYGCRETGCENKQKMKEFCNLPCKLAYNMYT